MEISESVEEALDGVASAIRLVSGAIFPSDSPGGPCPAGGHVASLAEAIMGVTRGLLEISSGLHDIAEAIRERP